MAVFAVIAQGYNAALAARLPNKFPRHFEIAHGQYVVAAINLTAQQVAQELGPNGEVGNFVVFSVAGYWGFHRKDLWEWLTLNSG